MPEMKDEVGQIFLDTANWLILNSSQGTDTGNAMMAQSNQLQHLASLFFAPTTSIVS
jgi:Mg/Co/Ni transporter MgtE